MKIMFIGCKTKVTDKELEKYSKYIIEKYFNGNEKDIKWYLNETTSEQTIPTVGVFPALNGYMTEDDYCDEVNIEDTSILTLGCEIMQLSILDSDIDYAVFLPGWSSSKEAKIKEHILKMRNIDCIYIEACMRKDLLNG